MGLRDSQLDSVPVHQPFWRPVPLAGSSACAAADEAVPQLPLPQGSSHVLAAWKPCIVFSDTSRTTFNALYPTQINKLS